MREPSTQIELEIDAMLRLAEPGKAERLFEWRVRTNHKSERVGPGHIFPKVDGNAARLSLCRRVSISVSHELGFYSRSTGDSEDVARCQHCLHALGRIGV